MNPREVYERHPASAGREAQCKLRPHEWDLLLRIDGQRTVQELGAACKLDLPWIASDIERLQELELVRVVEVGLEEYQQRFVRSREPAPKPASPPPAAEPADPRPAATTDGKRVSFSLRRGEGTTASRPAAAPVEPPSFAAPVPVPSAPAPVEEHRLKPLLDFITGHSGGGTVGQLAAYRVFLKVPNDLLRQAGIRSLNLVGEDFAIRDANVWRLLLNAVEEVIGRRYVPPAPPAANLVAA